MPGFDTMRSGDIGKRRKEIATMIKGCWRSCIESGDGMGPEASDSTTEDWMSVDTNTTEEAMAAINPQDKPFVADAIIANPPSFAHVHCAEKLGCPLRESTSLKIVVASLTPTQTSCSPCPTPRPSPSRIR